MCLQRRRRMKIVEKGRGSKRMMIGRSIELGTAMIVIGNFVWITICRFARGRAWRMCSQLVFVSLPAIFGSIWGIGQWARLEMVKDYSWHGATERDSRKDEAVVFIFIFATAGLLIWAAIKPWVGKWVDVSFLFSTNQAQNYSWPFGSTECERTKELYTGFESVWQLRLDVTVYPGEGSLCIQRWR